MIPGYRAAGAQCLIVNGVVDPVTGPAAGLPSVTIMTCRLRADAGDLQEVSGHPAGRGDDADGQIMLICGPAGVGKSTIGFAFYLRCLRAGLSAGYLDLDQLGFVRPLTAQDRHRLKARNLAAVWRNYRAAGATHLIATGPIEDASAAASYLAELPAATVTLCRLRAGLGELMIDTDGRAPGDSTELIGSGSGWPAPD